MNTNNKTKRKSGLFRLIEIAGTKKSWLIVSIILAVLGTAIQFVPVVIIYQVIVELSTHVRDIANIDRNYLVNLGLISLFSVGLFGILIYSSLMLSHVAAFNILYEIRVKLTEKLSKLSMGFFTQKASGEIKKIMSEDVEKIELFVAHHITDISSAIVFPVFMIGYLFIMDWCLAIAALIPLPFCILVQLKMFSSMDEYQNYHNALEKMNAAVVEYVRGMPVVKVFNAAVDSFKKLKDSIFVYKVHTNKITKDYSTTYPLFLTALSSSLIFIIPVSVFLLSKTDNYENLIPKVLLFLIVGCGMFFPFLKLMFTGGFLKQISIGVDRIDDILYEDEIPETKTGLIPADNSIVFDSVTFAYNEKNVLHDINFTAEPNSITALVGPSGSGKTTIGLLTARFWDVNSGSVKLGGVDIKDISIEELMNRVSFVFQDSFLFYDTIAENIRMGNNSASMNEVIEAAMAAQCHEFIEKLPDGYNTYVGERGTYLSGGEQQRIGIARAILKNTPVIILDEATAFADPENEGRILDAISKLIINKTVLIIAHRLSTIMNVDQILVIDNGRIVQKGTHDKLIKSDGLYRNMWSSFSSSREWIIEQKRRDLR